MKASVPSKNIIRGHLKPIHTITLYKLYANLKCNTPLEKKGNVNLHALTSMQTKNQNRKHKTAFPACFDKTLLFKGNKSKRREREINITVSPG